MALEGVFGRDPPGKVQRDLVAAPREIPGRGPARHEVGRRLRSRGEVPCRSQRALYALLPGAHPQFQFHRALSQAAGCTGPLNRCSVFGSKEAGARLNAMLEMGQSRPWQEALEKIAGTRQMDASAIRDYFAPLQKW